MTTLTRQSTRLAAAALVLLAAAVWTGSAQGERFLLTGGGVIEGTLLNPDEIPRRQYVIQTAHGRLVVDRTQVTEVVRQRPEEIEYHHLRHEYPDTVEGQWALAEWCRERSLGAQRKTHLERVLALDTDHAAARRALGYSRTPKGWMTQDEVMTDRGYVRYRGRWVLPQEVESLERRRKVNLAEKEWYGRLKTWRDWLEGDRASEAARQIAAIDDPFAAKALTSFLEKEPHAGIRRLYIEPLVRLGTAEALSAVVDTSLHDEVEEVRLTALDFLATLEGHPTTGRYVAALRDKDHVVINRAAVALARLGDPSAVGPLIDSLVTVHKHQLPATDSAGISAGFGSVNGKPVGGGISAGSRPPQVVVEERQNQDVLDALIKLTGANFHFRVKAWKDWLAAQQPEESLGLRGRE